MAGAKQMQGEAVRVLELWPGNSSVSEVKKVLVVGGDVEWAYAFKALHPHVQVELVGKARYLLTDEEEEKLARKYLSARRMAELPSLRDYDIVYLSLVQGEVAPDEMLELLFTARGLCRSGGMLLWREHELRPAPPHIPGMTRHNPLNP